jgi:hypothetical protein
MKKEKLTKNESKKGIRAYGLYVKKRNKKYLHELTVTFEEVKN